MAYEHATKTILLGSNCCICGRPLCDATSVEVGIGPECRDRCGLGDGGIADDLRTQCNELTRLAAQLAVAGDVRGVRIVALKIQQLGLTTLAELVASRFVDAEVLAKKSRITIVEDPNGFLAVTTPFRRDPEFVTAWRAIPGRKYAYGKNFIPIAEKPALFKLLIRFFPGKYATGCKGVFRIPEPKEEVSA